MTRARRSAREVLNTSDLAAVIALGEGFTTEFKRTAVSGLGREICAFANATGGVILIGVTDGGEIVGVHDHNASKSKIQSVARSADPPIAVDVACVDDLLCVTVPEQHGKPYSFGGNFFLRVGATSQQMSRDEIREFFLREGLVRFDEAPCRGFNLEADLTPEIWRKFSRRSRIPEDMAAIGTLENLHLLADGTMTNAGAWLLATDIARFNVQAGVTCAVFRGKTKAHILDRKEFTLDLVSNFEDSMAYMQSKLNTALIPNALGREERLELPEDALREALVNAIAHRDYRSTANVQTYIFRDRLEIVSPGGLPAGMREEDLGTRSVPRNPLLFGVLYRMGLVEQIGSGIRRIRQLCRDYDVPEPLIEVAEHWFSTIFIRPEDSSIGTGMRHADSREALQVAPQVKALVRVLEGELSRSEILRKLGLKDRLHLAAHYLRPALDDGYVEMTYPNSPRSRNQKYRLTEKGYAVLERLSPPRALADRPARHAAQQVREDGPASTPHVPRMYPASRKSCASTRRRANKVGNPTDPRASRPHPSRQEIPSPGDCRRVGGDDLAGQTPQQQPRIPPDEPWQGATGSIENAVIPASAQSLL